MLRLSSFLLLASLLSSFVSSPSSVSAIDVGRVQVGGGNCYPFNCYPSYRYQSGFAAHDFDSTGKITIKTITVYGTQAVNYGNIVMTAATYRLRFGYASRTPDQFTSSYDANVGTGGLQDFLTITVPPGQDYTNAHYTFCAQTPFTYDPSQGPLVFDVTFLNKIQQGNGYSDANYDGYDEDRIFDNAGAFDLQPGYNGGYRDAYAPIFGFNTHSECGVSNHQNDPVGGANGDPQFMGFLGQSYQVHGASNTVYNILSSPTLQYNALFNYLESGACRAGTPCFSHPGNYFGEVGLMIKDETGSVSTVKVTAGPVNEGFTVQRFNPSANSTTTLSPSDEFSIGSYKLQFVSPFEFVVQSDEFNIRMQNSDMFINQDVSIGLGLTKQIAEYKKAVKNNNVDEVNRIESTLPHGILGQSWNKATYPNRWKYIAGQLFDYIETDILGNTFKYNRF